MSSDEQFTPTEFEARQVYAAGDVHLEAEFDRMIAGVERAAAVKALREAKAAVTTLLADPAIYQSESVRGVAAALFAIEGVIEGGESA